MTEKTLTTENIKPALDALRGELAPWPVVAKKQDRLNTAQLNAANSGITSSLVAQIIANTAAIRALESAITGTGLRALVVSSLPAIGTQGILYIVPVTTYDPETDADVVNYSNEYIWIVAPDAPVTEGYYEQVGQTGIVINNGQLTITVNGTSVGTFTANQSGDTTAAITVPTNADYVDLSTNQTIAGVKTFSSTINGTASKAIADEDGTSIKTGYVNVAGTQTVSGQKTWSGVNYFNNENLYQTATNPRYAFKSSMLEIGVQPSGHCTATVDWLDSNDVELGYSRFVEYNNSIQTYEVLLKNKAENGSLSPAGNDISASLQLALFKTGSSQLNIGADTVAPTSNNSTSLGSSSYQWSSVYAQSYYYNGTQWGLDQANTWTGYNTFTSYIALQESAVIPAGGYGKGIAFKDYQNNRFGYIQPCLTPDSAKRLLIGVDSGDIALNSNLIPNANNSVNLGTSTNKWKTLNGINPGALSLPAVATTWLDTTGWVLDGTTENSLPISGSTMVFSPGWLQFRVTHTRGVSSFVKVSASYRMWTAQDENCLQSYTLWMPVLADDSFTVIIKADSVQVRFQPCLGNV